MCGVFGVIFTDNNDKFIDREKFIRANNLLAHRGPDDSGYWFNDTNKIGFGHRRLSILDLSKKGRQPMTDLSKRVTITYNGEIYNYLEIKDILKKEGYEFNSKTDTEVIIYAYLHWGINCVKKFVGMFSFCLYDKKLNKLFLVRDRLGIKPLFYKFNTDLICFASEIKSILEYCGKENINYDALTSYFKYRYVLGGITFYENIQSLEPGNILEFNFSSFDFKITKYWELEKIPDKNKNRPSIREVSKNIYDLLFKAVEHRKISDVPIGSYLSGGLDSSIITSLMSNSGVDKITTFTIGFSESNEFDYARQVADMYKTDHHEVVVDDEIFWELNDKMIEYKDAPLAVPNEVLIYMMSMKLKEYFTVVLSGEGADELFGGYGRIFRSPFDYNKYRILKEKFDADNEIFQNLKFKYKSELPFNSEIDFFLYNYDYFPLEVNELFFNTDLLKLLKDNNYAKHFMENEFGSLKELSMYDKFLWMFQKHHLLGLLGRLDVSTMAASVEGRVPFVDHLLIEYVNSLPFEYKNKWNDENSIVSSIFLNSNEISEKFDTPKFLLRDIFRNKLPDDITKRRKIGFPVPLNSLLNKKKLNKIYEVILDGSLIKEGLFNSEKMFSFLTSRKELFAQNYNDAFKLWMIYNLEKWYSIYF